MSNVKSKLSHKEEERLDSGMEGLDTFFANITPRQAESSAGVSQAVVEQLVQKQIKEQLQQMQVTAATIRTLSPKKVPKTSLLKNKEGLYFSDQISEWLDQEWKKLPRKHQKKSKSWIVEQILRQHWGLPPLEE
jgi:hypothetical protein